MRPRAGAAGRAAAADGRRRWRRSRPSSAGLQRRGSAAPSCWPRSRRSKAKMRRIPFIDPIDIRYRRFETVPKPVAQAVMFCLMDVSGSMTEHMKDLAKRFYMLLYVFLKRRYRHVEIVFIRHTDRAEEVDEETFFHGPASGGTLVSSALQAMHDIVAVAVPSGGLEHLRRAGLRRRQFLRRRRGCRPAADREDPAGQPVFRLSRGRRRRAAVTFDMPNSSLWTLYERLRAEWRAAVDAQGQRAQRDLPGVPRSVPAPRKAGEGRAMTRDRPNCCFRAPTGISRRCSGSTTPARRSRIDELASTSIPTRSRSSPPSRCWTPIPRSACRCSTSTGRSASTSPIRRHPTARG